MTETSVIGGPGPDVIYDDDGPNAFDGGAGSDRVSYIGSSRGVIADLTSRSAYKVLSILPMGDSITYGVIASSSDTESGGYRKFMLEQLDALNVKIDFIGSLSNGPATMEDRDHEGHRGWTVNQLNGIDDDVLAATNPDAVLLLAGTNDSSTDSVPTMLQDLRNLLLSLTSSDPTLTVFVGSLPPIRVGQQPQARADRVDAYNDAMPGLIAELAAQGHKVIFVDMRDLTPDDITAPPLDSGLHPTADGYAKIAPHWMGALEQHFGLDGTGIGTDRDTFTSIENLTGSSFADQLGGDEGANVLDGLAGDDLLEGSGGFDQLIGGLGADTLVGGAGDDVYYVDNIGDKTIEETNGGIDETHAYTNWTLADNVENLFLRSAANLAGKGNGLANALMGNSGANRLEGLGGSDQLDGRGGSDRLVGGLGADILTGGTGNDTFVFTAGGGHDTITDFGLSGDDVLEISGYQSYSELRQIGSDTLVVFSDSDAVLLKDVTSTSLSSSDFVWIDPLNEPPPGSIVGDEGNNTLAGGPGAERPLRIGRPRHLERKRGRRHAGRRRG
jgi:Ca2+-binding RTX toxin-like protein